MVKKSKNKTSYSLSRFIPKQAATFVSCVKLWEKEVHGEEIKKQDFVFT
jgi:hypothetical protein